MTEQLKASIVLGLLFFTSPHLWAQERINLQEGSFHYTHFDELKIGTGRSLVFERTYSSRSDFEGILGPGWCHELEWQLRAIDEGFELHLCDQVVGLKPSEVQTIFNQKRLTHEGQILTFDGQGWLTGISDHGWEWKIVRDPNGKLRSLKHGTEGLVQLSFVKAGQRLHGLKIFNHEIGYSYSQGKLSEAVAQATEPYAYDELDHLIRIGSGGFLQMSFDPLYDRIVMIKKQGCQTEFRYQSSETATQVIDQVQVQKSCKAKTVDQHREVFEYRKTAHHLIQLVRASSL